MLWSRTTMAEGLIGPDDEADAPTGTAASDPWQPRVERERALSFERGQAIQALHGARPAGGRRHGRGLRRLRSRARSPGRGEGAPREALGNGQGLVVVAPRGAGHGQAAAPERGRDLRRRDGQRARVHRHGAPRGRDGEDVAPVATSRLARDPRGLHRRGARPRGGARRGARAPRLQAPQRHDHARRAGARHGLRGGPAGRLRRRAGHDRDAERRRASSLPRGEPHAHGRARGDARVHGARAVPGRRAHRRAHRPVQLLRRAVRGALRRAALRQGRHQRASQPRRLGERPARASPEPRATVAPPRRAARVAAQARRAVALDARAAGGAVG